MTAPNLKSPASITGRTARYAPTTVIGSALSNAASSNKVLKINSIFCANISGVATADISISIYNGVTDRHIAKSISVPVAATQIISTKDTYFYLEEGDSIRALASVNSYIEVVIGYEEIE